MTHLTATERAGLSSENITIDQYNESLEARRIAFVQYIKDEYPDLGTMDECDWDDQYENWMGLDSQL